MKFSGFHPELFEQRARALEHLSEAGLVWLSDFSTVDLLQEDYGVEVCGISEESAANHIADLLCDLFPDWRYGRISYQDKSRDRGWKVEIFKWSRDDKDSQTA